jgi:hypothetical protein
MRRFFAAILFLVTAPAALAQTSPPTFGIPVDCKFGENCDVMLFVDHDRGSGWRDFRCGYLSYDTHKGTDIRIRTIDLMLRGVDVMAAAPGRVSTVRRGMADVSYKAIARDVITRRGLGNVVIINHGKGWQTIYAHLKKGSIRVAKGQAVKAGQVLGQVGMSGLAQVPHLHFGVLKNRKTIDPFNGTNTVQECKSTGSSLWTPKALRKMRYPGAFILNAGFSDSAKFNRIALTYGLDEKDNFYRKAPNFIFAVDFGGARKGDKYVMRIISPNKKILAKSEKTIASIVQFKFDFVGRKGRGRTWPKGKYTGQFELYRTEGGKRRKILETAREIWVR